MSITRNRRIVMLVRKMVAWPNRQPLLTPLSRCLMRALANIAMRKAQVEPVIDLVALHEQWQRSAPPLANYKLIKIENDTAYAEIHSECALRGTGDVAACHRMMEYDRQVMRTIGGELVVLESQAMPGRTFCTVVMRREGKEMQDFIPAHLRQHHVDPSAARTTANPDAN